MKLKHVDLITDSVFQDAREVNTKFSKTFMTYFFPVGDEVRQIVVDWVVYLKDDLHYGYDDPLFPKTNIAQGEDMTFKQDGLKREHWSTASPIRKIFKEAFETVRLPYYNPHSFRNTLAWLGEALCQTPEDFKAWSQNLGHEKVLTTFYSYGEVQPRRQAEIICELKSPRGKFGLDEEKLADAIYRKMSAPSAN
jgi:integrase